jgi:hypothetical protein
VHRRHRTGRGRDERVPDGRRVPEPVERGVDGGVGQLLAEQALEARREDAGRLDRGALGDEHAVAGARAVRADEVRGVADRECGAPADGRPRAVGVSPGVSGDDAHAQGLRLAVEHLPERGERLVGRVAREVQVDREVRRRQPGDGDVRQQDVDREPRGPLHPEVGEDEDGVRGEREDAVADVYRAEIDAVVRAEADVPAVCAELWIDVLVEERAVDLAHVLVAHGSGFCRR